MLRLDMLFFFSGFFFFKQKTAYEMRISDWSSDVCSSDLTFQKSFSIRMLPGFILCLVCESQMIVDRRGDADNGRSPCSRVSRRSHVIGRSGRAEANASTGDAKSGRSEERRVGKECGSQGRSRWSPSH